MRLFKTAGIIIRVLFRFPIEICRGCREIREAANWKAMPEIFKRTKRARIEKIRIYWFIKRRIFHTREGQMLPKTLRVIRFILFPIQSIGMIAQESVYRFDEDMLIVDGKRISFEKLYHLFSKGDGVFIKEGDIFRKLPPSAFCKKIYNFEKHPYARLDATWDGH